MKNSVRPSICPFVRGFVISLNNVPTVCRRFDSSLFSFSKVLVISSIILVLKKLQSMNESYEMWRDNTIVERALDLSLARYSLARLETSELRYREVGLQTFKNHGEFNFLTYCYNQSHYIKVTQGDIFMEQNMRFGLILGWLPRVGDF